MVHSFRREWFIALLAYGCVLLLLSVTFATDLMSPRLFAIAVLVSAIICFLVLFRMFRKVRTEGVLANQATPLSREQIERRLLWSKIGIVIWSTLAVVGLWETRGGPFAPRLIGLCVNLAFLMGSIVSLREYRKKLQQLRSGD